MFFKIRGLLTALYPPNRLFLETGPFVWEVFIPLNLFDFFREEYLEQRVELYVVPIIRKNEFVELYGFLTAEDRELFLKLNTLSKIGPKLALNLVSFFDHEKLKILVKERRIDELSRVPGIGPKRAEKLLLELKNLFGKPQKKALELCGEREKLFQDAKASLVNLGFKSQEAEEALIKVYEEGDSLESLLKKALRELAPILKEETKR